MAKILTGWTTAFNSIQSKLEKFITNYRMRTTVSSDNLDK